jgi:hypothetical protein
MRYVCIYADSADVRTLLALALLAALHMLRVQRDLTCGRRVATFRAALMACLVFRVGALVGGIAMERH